MYNEPSSTLLNSTVGGSLIANGDNTLSNGILSITKNASNWMNIQMLHVDEQF